MLKDLSLAVPPSPCIFRVCDGIGTPTWLCPPFPFTRAADAPWAQALPCFPHKAVYILVLSSRGLLQDCMEHFAVPLYLSLEALKWHYKKSICDQLTFFFICCMPNHPSPLLLSRTTLLWRTSHTGTQRNPSGKLVTAVFPSRRAFWMRYGQTTTSNHISTFQASLDGTLDLRVFYMNNAFQYEIKS